jgi:hypothetical protein
MLAAEGKKLIDRYVTWLKQGYEVETGSGYTLISTPFLDPHNDELQIFLEQEGENLKLSDDGYTLADLRDSGLEINTPKRDAHVRQILNGFGVRQEGGELVVTATPRDFPQKKHSLIQAMLAIHDLSVMGQAQVLQFFEEDVARYLQEKQVPVVRNIKLPGRSGFDHLFNFVAPAQRTRRETVLQAINHLSRDFAMSVAFAVNDVRLLRGADSFGATAIINDAETRPADEFLDALRAYGIKPFVWSNRDSLVAEFGSN